MKKFLFSLFALVAFVACNTVEPDVPPIDEPVVEYTNEYSFKVDSLSRIDAFLRTTFTDLVFDSYPTITGYGDVCKSSGTFKGPDAGELRRMFYDVDLDGVTIEVFDSNNNLVFPARDKATAIGAGKVVNTVNANYTISGMSMSVLATLQNATQVFEPLDICGAYGEPLTTMYVISNYWSIGDTRDCNWHQGRDYCITGDLNEDCGVRSDYSRLAFGGRRHSNIDYIEFFTKEDWHPETYGWDAFPSDLEKSTITGLRLVSGGGENPPSKITDSATGIVWTKCPVYFCSQDVVNAYGGDEYRTGAGDLNNGAKGDYLYLYITRDVRTGRKIMLVNPYLAQYESKWGATTASTARHGEDALIPRTLFSSMLTWSSPNWQCYPSSIFSQLADRVDGSVAKDLAKYIRPGDSQRVDFIRCYDINMGMSVDKDNDGDGYPDVCGNFNRNAKGDVEVFISYSFITPADTEFWSRF